MRDLPGEAAAADRGGGKQGHRAEGPAMTPRDRPTIAQLQAIAACPDCASDVTLSLSDDGVWHANVSHDATCPWLRARLCDE